MPSHSIPVFQDMPAFPVPHADPADIAHEIMPFFRVFKDGRVEKFLQSPRVPPPSGDGAAVHSKDVIILLEHDVGARLFLPKSAKPDEKLPLVVYYHGGGFAIESAFGAIYTNYLAAVAAAAHVIVVSVEYRLAPEHPIPACYEDCWAVTKWVGSHSTGQGPDAWINTHADFTRAFFAGDSAGANFAHNMAVKAGTGGDIKPVGMLLAHPFFGDGKQDHLWEYICSDFAGWEDPRLNPMAHPGVMAGIVCNKILIFTSGKDFLKERGELYHAALKKSGWSGAVEVVDFEEEEHVFHILTPARENAGALMKWVVSFFNAA